MNKKSLVYLGYLISFVLLLLSIFSILQIYQRFNDLNYSIINGVNLAIKNGLMLSDLRGSVKDIADSYVNSKVMASSYLYNDVNNVIISSFDKDKCEVKNSIFNLNESKYTSLNINLTKNQEIYFCFRNNIFIKSNTEYKEIAHWIMGFKLNKEIIYSNLKHIIIFTIIISTVIICIFLLLISRLEKSRRKELTKDIARKVKHEIIRPVAKIESISDLMIISLENKLKDVSYSDLYQINIISKSYKLIVRSMFSYVINKDNLEFVIKNEPIYLQNTINKSINIAIKSKKINLIFKKEIPQFFEDNSILIDETFLVISISNILTNAYEAVFRNKLDDLTVEINAYYINEVLSLNFKNYGSYILKEKFKTVFNPGFSGNVSTNSGYGLTILKDIVELYDGEVNIDSFYDENDIKKSWAQISIKFKKIKHMRNTNNIVDIYSVKVKNNKPLFHHKLNILVCDDEIFFIDKFKNMFSIIDSNYINVDYFFDSENQMNLIENAIYDLVIMDLKFYDNEKYGYELIKLIRKNKNNTYIALHTSTFFEDIEENYRQLKINEFVQKTISYEKLTDLLIKVQDIKYNVITDPIIKEENKKLNIIVVDDEPHFYEDWKQLNKDCNFYIFTDFDDLFDNFDKNKVNISIINLVITDYYFDKIEQGMNLFSSNYLETLKETYDYSGLIILATNGSSVNSELIDETIDKKPLKINDLLKKLSKSI